MDKPAGDRGEDVLPPAIRACVRVLEDENQLPISDRASAQRRCGQRESNRGNGHAGGAAYGDAISFAPDDPVSVSLKNNIVVQKNGIPYLRISDSSLSGEANLWWGQGSSPSQTTGNVNADPLFVDELGKNFRLQSGSLARNAGVPSGASKDKDGVPRPQESMFDIGAFEYAPPEE